MRRLYKRGKIWWACVRGPEGTTVRISTKCKDRKAAGRRADEQEREWADPAYLASKITVTDALENAITDRESRGRSSATIGYYGTKGSQVARVLGGDTPLAHVDARAVDRLIATRLGEGVARSTVAKELGVLRVALRHAYRRGEYRTDPAKVLPNDFGAAYVPRTTWLTPAQLEALLWCLPRARAGHVAWIVATATRLSESLRARPEDVTERAVHVRGTKTATSLRTIPITTIARPLLDLALLAAARPEKTGTLFATWGNVRRDLHVACDKAGVPRVSPNDLRRTCAKWLRNAGVPTDAIGGMLGHADSRMVERVYGRLDTADLGRLIERSASVPILYQTQWMQTHPVDTGDNSND